MSEVSVLMTVYNGMPYLRPAVQSVLEQTHSDFKFVIVNDGSDDDTADYLNSIDDPRLTVVWQENQGTAKAANHGLSLIDTPFVARMDADDIALPTRLEKQLAFLKSHPEVGIVGAQIAPVGEKGVGQSLGLPVTHDAIFPMMMEGCHGMAHSVIMIRTKVLKELGGYWSFKMIDDWDMMLRVGEVSKLANLDEVLNHYRVHSGSLNGKSMWRMYRHIGYAIDRAKRRQAGQPFAEYEEFLAEMNNRPFWQRASEWMHVHAMTNYRLAVADIFGGRRAFGYTRLAYSALCSPKRTLHRLKRIRDRVKHKDQLVEEQSAAPAIRIAQRL